MILENTTIQLSFAAFSDAAVVSFFGCSAGFCRMFPARFCCALNVDHHDPWGILSIKS